MNFDKSLSLALEALPKWRKMRLRRKRGESKENSENKPTQPAELLIQLPLELASELDGHKTSLERSLSIISQIIPQLKSDVKTALDMLFKIRLKFHFSETVGEHFEILQQEWLNVLQQLDHIGNMIPAGKKYRNIRNDFRALRDHLRRTIGRFISNNPAGNLPDHFSTD